MPDPEAAHWVIDDGITDPARFFPLVPRLLPNATLFFVEGTSIARDVRACYARFRDPGRYLPRRQTLWPPSKRLRCVASAELFQALGQLSERHAVPELLDHFSLYEGVHPLLKWHDAFMNSLLLNGEVPESTIEALAREFGCQYGHVQEHDWEV